MLGTILGWIVYGSFGLSSVITYFNHASSNSRIRRKGKEIKPITTNSLTENIKYFVKDFGFLFVPVVNVVKSIKQLVKKDAEFDSENIARLMDRDRLEDAKKIEEPARTPAKTETKKEVRTTKPASVAPAKEVKKVKTVAEMDCFEREAYYKSEYEKLTALHAKAKAEHKSVEVLNAITARIKPIVVEYRKALRECEIAKLKEAKNMILLGMESEKKLQLK